MVGQVARLGGALTHRDYIAVDMISVRKITRDCYQ